MRGHIILFGLAVLAPQVAMAQQSVRQPGCEAPVTCFQPQRREVGAPETARRPGAFVRAPETGEVSGESTAMGIRGMSIRLPALTLEMPEIRMPSLVRYRRNPEMQVESSRAPYVEGEAIEFNQVPPRGDIETAPAPRRDRPEAGVPPRYVPPTCDAPYYYRPSCDAPDVPGAASASAREQMLLERLAQREAELNEIRQQFVHLERRVAAAIDQAPAPAARRVRPAGTVRVESAEYDELPQDGVTDIPEPPATSKRKPPVPAARVVRSQSPVVPAADYEPAARPMTNDSAVRRFPAAPVAEVAKRPVMRQGHAPFNPALSGR